MQSDQNKSTISTIKYEANIESHTSQLKQLLATRPIHYSNWPSFDKSELDNSAGVYQFFEVRDGKQYSIYVGKGGFGAGEDWSLAKRLNQHFRVSQKNTLLGKAAAYYNIDPILLKSKYEKGSLYLQWLVLRTRENRNNEKLPDLARELLWFECFAIAALEPLFTDG